MHTSLLCTGLRATESEEGCDVTLGFVETLLVIFIILKVTGHLTWPWLWVLSPLWITLSLMTVVVLLSIILVIVMALLDYLEEHERNVKRRTDAAKRASIRASFLSERKS